LSVFDKVQKKVTSGLVLYTPVMRRKFEVQSIGPDRVVFLVKKTRIEVSRDCLNGVPDFLKGKGWVDIGANHVSSINVAEGTLEKYLCRCTKTKSKRSQASYVAPLLEHMEVVYIDHKRPSKVRLKA
jgi:hypothetical protein